MGNINSINQIQKYNFDDVRNSINDKHVIISTLPENLQTCLIMGTVAVENEVKILNDLLRNHKDKTIVIYGKNNNDESIITKYKQLTGLGYINIYVYIGGLFEWLLLQEVYGEENFPTTSLELDILKYK
jgi:hypothetical protein